MTVEIRLSFASTPVVRGTAGQDRWIQRRIGRSVFDQFPSLNWGDVAGKGLMGSFGVVVLPEALDQSGGVVQGAGLMDPEIPLARVRCDRSFFPWVCG